MTMTIELKNYDGVVKGLKECRKDLAKKVSKAMKSVGTRGAKTAVQQQVRKVYNVTVSDVNSRFHYNENGGINIEGVHIPFYELVWKQDKSFTVAHPSFKMKPKSRPGGRRAYRVTFAPLKGGSVPVGSTTGQGVFLASPKGSTQPYTKLQAKSWVKLANGWHSTPIDMVPTHLSIPQMVDNEKVQPNIENEIVKRLEKAL